MKNVTTNEVSQDSLIEIKLAYLTHSSLWPALYYCWLVILTFYNLPLEMCMKSKFMFLFTIILSPNSPSRNINVYFQSLIDKLNQLWSSKNLKYDVLYKLFIVNGLSFYMFNIKTTTNKNNERATFKEDLHVSWILTIRSLFSLCDFRFLWTIDFWVFGCVFFNDILKFQLWWQ